jgi:hypothetical protein
MTTSIEQWKSRAFIGVLALISITVNVSYAHVHHRYQNGSDFVQQLQQRQSTAAITAPPQPVAPQPALDYESRPQPISASYNSVVERPVFLPAVQDSPSSDFVIMQKSRTEHATDAEQHLRKEERQQEREQRKEARESIAINSIVGLNTNAAETTRESKRTGHEALSPKAKDHVAETRSAAHVSERTKENSTPQIAHEQGKNAERINGGNSIKKAVDTKNEGTPKEAKIVAAPVAPAKEIKTASASQTPPANEAGSSHEQKEKEVKTPPHATAIETGGQSGTENESQNSRRDSKQQNEHNQNQNSQARQQNQQNQQNQNNRNNGGGNGSGGGRKR